MILLFSYCINKIQMEIYEDWLSSKMTRAEVRELSDDEKKERKRLQQKNYDKKYRENHPEKYKETQRQYREENREKEKERNKKFRENHPEKSKEYYENNIEKIKEYYQTPIGKKSKTLSKWKQLGLEETKEDLEWIYELYLTQELCYSCDCILTRNGDNSKDQACMDHDHITNRFRQICCRSCNTQDRWMKYWC